jgi:hypothetical protein
MNEEALRALVRDTIARLNGDLPPEGGSHGSGWSGGRSDAHTSSHYRYQLTPTDGPCLIEPTVRCNHCGYCESHGH